MGRPRTRPRRSAFGLGVVRTVAQSRKRFAALATICALGVTMVVGLRVACVDLRASADRFFDDQSLFDLRVQSTLGLTDEDVAALANLDGVEKAEGGYAETVYTSVGSGSEKVDVKALSPSGLNEPEVLEGHLPVTEDQVAVTRRYAQEAGVSLGDTVSFHGADDGDEDASTVFERRDYTVSAIVLDPADINAGNGSMSFRSSGDASHAFFVLPSAVTSDVYTVVYLTVEGGKEPLCYSGDYDDLVDQVRQQVEGVREEREAARGQGLRDDANAQIDSQQAEAQSQLDDAQAQVDESQAKLDEGAAELADGRAQLEGGYARLDAAERELTSNEAAVSAGLLQIAEGLGCSVGQIPATLDARRADIAAGREDLAAGRAQLAAGRAQIESSVKMLCSLSYVGDAWPSAAWDRLAAATTVEEAQAAAAEVSAVVDPYVRQATSALDGLVEYLRSDEVASAGSALDQMPEGVQRRVQELIAQAPEGVQQVVNGLLGLSPSVLADQLQSMRDTVSQMGQLAPGMVEVVRGEVRLRAAGEELDSGEEQLSQAAAGYEQLVDARAQLDAGRAQMDASRQTLDENASQLADGQAELDAGQDQIDDAQATLDQRRADALALIADAREQAAGISDATWYVQDRSSLSSYASVESDASSIEAIGTVIPLVFLVVAVLISLTTMTRMVEEERGLIGLYKALGYGRARILSKYVAYAASACAVGGVVGNVLGFVVLPLILFTIFQTMYALPEFLLSFDALWALGSVALFAACIVGATALTCRRELRESPASLMRPKAPRAGSRILLERVRPLWRRLGFLSKVTARNIFRYKRRFLMTVLGIAGTTALLVCGFGIRDTVLTLAERQYGDAGVVNYDLMAVTSPDELESFATDLSADPEVESFVPVGVDSLTISYGAARESVQLVVVPDGVSLDGYVSLASDDGGTLGLGDTGAVVTKNAEQVLGFSAGDQLHVQDSALREADVTVDAVCRNYLGNIVFMSQSAYERAFGEKAPLNGLLASLTGSQDEQVELAERLSQDGRALSVTSTAKLVRDFSSAFTLINTVVYVVIVLAAALSFTVVFTLSNTNISERERELATIKVLGFRRSEVRRYVNRESLVLTGIGVAVGLPLGYALTRSLTWVLKMPSLYFDTVVEPLSYVLAAALAFAFTLLVNKMTDRALDRIDMVGALKSAE